MLPFYCSRSWRWQTNPLIQSLSLSHSHSLTCSSTESVSSLSLSTTIGPPPLGQPSSDDVVEAAEDDEDEEEDEEGELEAGAAPDADGDQLWQP